MVGKGNVENTPERNLPIPKVLLFDLGNVVLAADHTITHAYIKKLGVTSENAVKFFMIPEYSAFSRGEIDEHTFADALRTALHVPDIMNDELRTAHNEHIYALIPDMQKLLTQLTDQYGTHAIVFATDTNVWQTARQQELIDLSGYTIFASDKLHILKTDPEKEIADSQISFFQIVLQQLQISSAEILFIDDSPEKIVTANSYGLQTIHFENPEQLKETLGRRGILEK